MIDDIFEFCIDLVIDVIPNIVWKLLFLVIGIGITAIGVTIFNESTQTGSALIIAGIVLLTGSLISLLR